MEFSVSNLDYYKGLKIEKNEIAERELEKFATRVRSLAALKLPSKVSYDSEKGLFSSSQKSVSVNSSWFGSIFESSEAVSEEPSEGRYLENCEKLREFHEELKLFLSKFKEYCEASLNIDSLLQGLEGLILEYLDATSYLNIYQKAVENLLGEKSLYADWILLTGEEEKLEKVPLSKLDREYKALKGSIRELKELFSEANRSALLEKQKQRFLQREESETKTEEKPSEDGAKAELEKKLKELEEKLVEMSKSRVVSVLPPESLEKKGEEEVVEEKVDPVEAAYLEALESWKSEESRLNRLQETKGRALKAFERSPRIQQVDRDYVSAIYEKKGEDPSRGFVATYEAPFKKGQESVFELLEEFKTAKAARSKFAQQIQELKELLAKQLDLPKKPVKEEFSRSQPEESGSFPPHPGAGGPPPPSAGGPPPPSAGGPPPSSTSQAKKKGDEELFSQSISLNSFVLNKPEEEGMTWFDFKRQVGLVLELLYPELQAEERKALREQVLIEDRLFNQLEKKLEIYKSETEAQLAKIPATLKEFLASVQVAKSPVRRSDGSKAVDPLKKSYDDAVRRKKNLLANQKRLQTASSALQAARSRLVQLKNQAEVEEQEVKAAEEEIRGQEKKLEGDQKFYLKAASDYFNCLKGLNRLLKEKAFTAADLGLEPAAWKKFCSSTSLSSGQATLFARYEAALLLKAKEAVDQKKSG